MMMLNQVKKENKKTKRKGPSPTLEGTMDHFGKNAKDKRSGNKH
jgi:hypothetical protein